MASIVGRVCGIAGLARPSGPTSHLDHVVEGLQLALRHRGPDDSGSEILESRNTVVAICATRLAIQDCSQAGHQPMRSEPTGSWIAFNGELYNGGELRAELSRTGREFRGNSDTEVALAAWDEWGSDFLLRLRGMFALAVWDPRHDELLLARDRLGIKPLYYSSDGPTLAFASEVKTLLAQGLAKRRLSTEALLSYLAFGGVHEPSTIVDGVAALPPGHVARWSVRRGLEVSPYWSLADAFAVRSALTDRAEAVAAVRERLLDAVQCHLVGDVPLGVFLSGGIDSSALTALVAEAGDRPARTISVVFSEQEYSEKPFADAVAARFGTDHVEVHLCEEDLLAELPQALDAMDQPSVDGINTFVVSRAARESGLTVALSGLGGDELFAGYDTFRQGPQLDLLRRLVPAPAGRLAARAMHARMSSDRADKLGRWLSDSGTLASAYTLQRELVSPELATELAGRAYAHERCEAVAARASDPINAVSAKELNCFMRNVLLRDSDVMSMAHSLELRLPFLDHQLVELVAALPGRWKVERGRQKPLLVDALGGKVPAEIVDRAKMGFTFPFEHWLRGPLRREVEDCLTDPGHGGPVADALDGAAVERMWARFLAGETSWTRPWALYVAKAWGERRLRENATSAQAPGEC